MYFEVKKKIALKELSKKKELVPTIHIIEKSLEKDFFKKNPLENYEKEIISKKDCYTKITSDETSTFIVTSVSEKKTHEIPTSDYALGRDFLATKIKDFLTGDRQKVCINFFTKNDQFIKGCIVGLETYLYDFQKENKKITFNFLKTNRALSEKLTTDAIEIGNAINQARHLVNLPPNELNPKTYAQGIKKMFSKSKHISVTVWEGERLKKEKCFSLLTVGQASNNKSRLVHIKYKSKKSKGRPIAFVGKGITFDSGGLDLKPPQAMRLMKKDMGGSATLVGLAKWLDQNEIKKDIDIYLALAENSVSDNAFRPSDIIKTRSGKKIEIHNTDAEGRLVMIDAIDVAINAKNKPQCLIDVATLTGAGKVALGEDIASLFSNDDKLAEKLLSSSLKMGDPAWRMPLYSPYFKSMKSSFADFQNAASGFGGSITAALFLEKFTGDIPWAHFDIFGWTHGSVPSLPQAGGSGQSVQCLIDFLS